MDNLRVGSLALLLGLAAAVQLLRKPGNQSRGLIAALVGVAVSVLYTLVVARYALAIPAFVVLMLSCWVPGGISAMLVATRGKQLSVLIGVAILCGAAISLTEPAFNAVTHNQELIVALVVPSDASTSQVEASPETLGFHNDDETRAAKSEALNLVRSVGYPETFRVLSITREGKGRKSLAVIVIRNHVAKPVVLPEPDRSTVVYIQQSESWEKRPAQVRVLDRGITMSPPGATDESLGYFEIPDAQGVSLVGRIRGKLATAPH